MPAAKISWPAASTSRKRTESIDIHEAGIPACKGAERGIPCRRIDSLDARVIVDVLVVVAKADRVHEAGREAMRFLNGHDLPRGQSIKANVSKRIGRTIWSAVEKVRAEQTVSV